MSNKLRIKKWIITTKEEHTKAFFPSLASDNRAVHTLEVHGAAEVAIELQSFMNFISGNSKTLNILGPENKLQSIDISSEGLKKFCKMVLHLDPVHAEGVLHLHDNKGNIIKFNISDHAG